MRNLDVFEIFFEGKKKKKLKLLISYDVMIFIKDFPGFFFHTPD